MWELISGNYIRSLAFLSSLIQILIPTALIFFFWSSFFSHALLYPSATGSLFTRRLGFDFLMFPEDFFYKEKHTSEKYEGRYIVFYRDPHCVRILGNDFLNLDSFFSDHILSIGETDFFLYKTLWFVLSVIMLIGTLFNTTIDPSIFGIGTRLVYKMWLIFFIILISGYLSYMTWRKYILDSSYNFIPIPRLIFRRKFISLHLPSTRCIFICPLERFGEFDRERAKYLYESFLQFQNSESVYKGNTIDEVRLKKWASENVL